MDEEEMREKVNESQKESIEKQTDEDGDRVLEKGLNGTKRKERKSEKMSDETQLWNLKRKHWRKTRLLGWKGCPVPHYLNCVVENQIS